MSIKRWVVRSRSAILALFLAGISSWALPSGGFAACANDAGAAQNAAAPTEVNSAVRDFVAANRQAAAAVIAPRRGGGLNADQQEAIRTDPGLRADVCIRPDRTFAAVIQTQIAGIESADAKTAYAAVTGNQLIGGIGRSGGGSAGSVGGQTNPTGASPSDSSSAFQAFMSNSVSNAPNTVVYVVSKTC
jgi:hypothetical protein